MIVQNPEALTTIGRFFQNLPKYHTNRQISLVGDGQFIPAKTVQDSGFSIKDRM